MSPDPKFEHPLEVRDADRPALERAVSDLAKRGAERVEVAVRRLART